LHWRGKQSFLAKFPSRAWEPDEIEAGSCQIFAALAASMNQLLIITSVSDKSSWPKAATNHENLKPATPVGL
jgi:hypothetical protein